MCLAIPGRVVEIVDPVHRLAKVDVAGVRRTVNIGLLDEDGSTGADGEDSEPPAAGAPPRGVQPGDWVLIHVGFAMSKVDEDEAQATLSLLRGMGQDFEQEIEELKASAIE